MDRVGTRPRRSVLRRSDGRRARRVGGERRGAGGEARHAAGRRHPRPRSADGVRRAHHAGPVLRRGHPGGNAARRRVHARTTPRSTATSSSTSTPSTSGARRTTSSSATPATRSRRSTRATARAGWWSRSTASRWPTRRARSCCSRRTCRLATTCHATTSAWTCWCLGDDDRLRLQGPGDVLVGDDRRQRGARRGLELPRAAQLRDRGGGHDLLLQRARRHLRRRAAPRTPAQPVVLTRRLVTARAAGRRRR